MDFQQLLSIAAENNKRAQKEVTQSKRYTTALPPPKKEKRLSVDHAAIRARLEKKQQEIKQKASEEEAKKQQLLKIRAEAKNKSKKSAEKPKASAPTEGDHRKNGYADQKHKERHQSFLKKVEKVADRTRKEEADKPVSKAAPDRLKRPKKAASAPRGPMSYEQLLALAANQQKGGSTDDSKTPTRNGTGSEKSQSTKQNEWRDLRKDDMASKKALAARKLAEARRGDGQKPQRNGDFKSSGTSSAKTPGCSAASSSSHPHRTNWKLPTTSKKSGNPSRAKKPEAVTSKPMASTSKTKHSPVEIGKTRPDVRKNGAHSGERGKLAKQELERKRPTGKLQQSRVEEYFERKPAANRPRIVPPERSPPRRQSKLDSYYDRAPSSSSSGRPKAGQDRRAPSAGSQVSRKRPGLSSGHPSFRAKHGRLLSEEESDYEDDDFIDDTPLEEGNGEDVSHYIKEIFGYDKSKYEHVSDWQLRNMESSFRDVQREEARSARLGMQEDLEDIRREREELKRPKARTPTKKQRGR